MTQKKSTVKNYLFLHFAFFVYSLSAIFSKNAAMQPWLSPMFFLFAGLVVVVLAVYALLWQQVLKRFNLIEGYSSKGVVVIWNLLWAVLFFAETITVWNIIGSIVIVIGIGVVSSDAS